jgi:hypothetical protein
METPEAWIFGLKNQSLDQNSAAQQHYFLV